MCDCVITANRARSRRIHFEKLQLNLAFPAPPKTKDQLEWEEFTRKGPGYVVLQRQPARFPPGSYRRDLYEGPDWRVQYEREWSEKLVAAPAVEMTA